MRKSMIIALIVAFGFGWAAHRVLNETYLDIIQAQAAAQLQARDTIIERQAAEILSQQRRIRNLEGTVRDNLATIEYLLGGKVRPEQPSRAGVIRHFAKVTAFTAGPESTGKSPGHPAYGITTSGYHINIGAGERLAAAGPGIPFGTRVFVPGYGLAPVRDRGGAIDDGCIDVYFDRVEDARAWGVRHMQVLIIR